MSELQEVPPLSDLTGEPSLKDRIPGQAVIAALMEEQKAAGPRSRMARLLGASPLAPAGRSWYLGALGEVGVGRVLTETTRDGWHVLHAVPVGDGDTDIDHLLIGPGGIFTVNTKRHMGQNVWVAGRTFMVSGRKTQYIPKAESEANRAARLLSRVLRSGVRVGSLIVVADATKLTVREPPKQVVVLTSQHLLPWLRQLPAVFSREEVLRLVSVADRPTTWRKASPQESMSPAALGAAFAALEDELVGARRTRRRWALGLAFALLGAMTGDLDLPARLLLG